MEKLLFILIFVLFISVDVWYRGQKPKVTHGYTLTGIVSLVDVLKTIKENAFENSEFPVILSIENHLNVDQQKEMAAAFYTELSPFLHTAPVPNEEVKFPSPNEFKRKIFIKGKVPKEFFRESTKHGKKPGKELVAALRQYLPDGTKPETVKEPTEKLFDTDSRPKPKPSKPVNFYF